MAADCEAQGITLAGRLEEPWLAQLARSCELLAQRHDLDASARVEISPGPERGVSIRAALRDGRVATRFVDTPEALTATLQALLILPKPVSAAPPAPPQPAPPKPAHVPVAHGSAAQFAEPFVQLGLGAGVIGHVYGSPTYAAAGLSLCASLRVGPLLMEVSPRWEAEQTSHHPGLSDFEMHNLGIALTLGARVLSHQEVALELGGGLLVLQEAQTYAEAQSGKEVGADLVSGQVSAYARLLLGKPPLRWSIGLELNIAPSRLAHESRIRDILPALPSFGVGIGFGAHWES
jgi:hypothetical protein